MDVGTMARAQVNAYSTYTNFSGVKTKGAETANGAADAQAKEAEESLNEAYSINISDAAKQAQEAEGANKSKGLDTDTVNALQDQQATQEAAFYSLMIQAMTATNDKLQGWLDDGIGKLRSGDTEIDAFRFAMPEVATTPEEAAAAVAEGGDWSVDAVATRIFDLASAIAGNDPAKLEEMRAAVEEGFKQAGIAFKDATGEEKMPQITEDTHTEIMNRFDARMKELTGGEL